MHQYFEIDRYEYVNIDGYLKQYFERYNYWFCILYGCNN